MAHNLIETATFDPTVTVPDDGDTANSASIEVGMQSLANRTRTMRVREMPTTLTLGGDPALSIPAVIETMPAGINPSTTVVSPAFNTIRAGETILITGLVNLNCAGVGARFMWLRSMTTGVNIPGFWYNSTVDAEQMPICVSYTYPSPMPILAFDRIVLICDAGTPYDIMDHSNICITRFTEFF